MATGMKREKRESTDNTARVSRSRKSIRNILVCRSLFLMFIAIGDYIDGERTSGWLVRLLMEEEECRLNASGTSADRL